MPFNIPSPSELIKPGDIVTTFQNLYNLGFAILVALAFLSFVYGAFQYLLSGASFFNQQEGKNRMRSSLIALIIVLIIPPILNLINPKIFEGVEMQIPRMTVVIPGIIGDAYSEILVDGSVVRSYDNTLLEDFRQVPKLSVLPVQIANSVQIAHSYAKDRQGRNRYVVEHGGDLTLDSACNHFVYFVLKNGGAVPDICQLLGASQFHIMLTQPDFQNHARRLGFQWTVLDFSASKVLPGDILVKPKPPGKLHGHVSIVIPVKNKEGGYSLVSAEASYSSSTARIQADPERYLPHIREISNKRGFRWIVRPVPIR